LYVIHHNVKNNINKNYYLYEKMVLQVAVTKGPTWKFYFNPIISFEQYLSGDAPEPGHFVNFFDLPTGNFRDIEYWDSERDLHGSNSPELVERLQGILQKMKEDGYYSYAIEHPPADMYTWEFGPPEQREDLGNGHLRMVFSGPIFDSCYFDRVCILYYHLENLLETAKEYSDEYYFFCNNAYLCPCNDEDENCDCQKFK
jgi:hypothetical protein